MNDNNSGRISAASLGSVAGKGKIAYNALFPKDMLGFPMPGMLDFPIPVFLCGGILMELWDCIFGKSEKETRP